MLGCTTCGIHLCIACYEKFHQIDEIGDLKNTFQQESWEADDITEMITMANTKQLCKYLLASTRISSMTEKSESGLDEMAISSWEITFNNSSLLSTFLLLSQPLIPEISW